MVSPTADKLIKALKKANLTLEDRTALTTVLLDKLQALPLQSTIIVTPNGLIINGKELDVDQVINFRESCVALKENYARKVITEQVKYLAINIGVHNGLTNEQILFSKSALWNLQQIDNLLDQIV